MEQEYSKKNKAKPADDVDALTNEMLRASVSGVNTLNLSEKEALKSDGDAFSSIRLFSSKHNLGERGGVRLEQEVRKVMQAIQGKELTGKLKDDIFYELEDICYEVGVVSSKDANEVVNEVVNELYSIFRGLPMSGVLPTASASTGASYSGKRPQNLPLSQLPSKKVAGKKYEYIRAFMDVYSSNYGFKAINSAMREGKSDFYVLSDEIISEIKRTHGDDSFSRGAKRELDEIKYHGAGYYDKDKINDIKYTLYNQSGEYSVSYRGQDLSRSAAEKYASLMGTGQCIHSASILSVSSKKEAAEGFMVSNGAKWKAFFTIRGFSSIINNARYIPRGEGERVFSPYADFEVVKVSMRESSKTYFIELKEVKGNQKGSQVMPY
ncbi:hypothetical protein B9T65_05670 [Serratia marcescens]|uniref:hypothetical protein n=1 Tax=Serratia marcescens TaxID=615 RepID=UPI0006ECD83C|nr:hypothetical protein [Serratia marcescens]ALL39847.1 hypothetical protein AR325_23850 [Serratia marcescens]PHI52370.1 hypothetical protein B9T65_05670 [Serratia marcescens]UJA53646.1 hypothetical protein L1F17_22225 [Serratia marcescens]